MVARTSSKKNRSGGSGRRATLHSIKSTENGKDRSRSPKASHRSQIAPAARASALNGTTLTVRRADTPDLDTIISLNGRLAWEKYGKKLSPAALRSGILAQLGDSGSHGRYFVAERAGEVVGQVRVWTEHFDWEGSSAKVWWLDNCVSRFPRQGIFRALFDHVHALALATPGVIKLRLHVEEKNQEAIETYLAMGFMAGSFMMEMYLKRT